MATRSCPRCAFVQDEGAAECRRCGVVFARVRSGGAPRPREEPNQPKLAAQPSPAPRPSVETAAGPGLVRRFYRVFRWVALAVSLTVLVLILRQSSPPLVEIDRQAPARVEAKLAEMQQAAAIGIVRPLELDESELNGWLERNLALASSARAPGAQAKDPTIEEVRSNVQDVKIQLVEDRLRAWVQFDFHGKNLTLTLEGRLFTQGGQLRLEPTAAWLGSLPVPRAALQRAAARLFSDPSNAANLRLPPDVADVRVAGGRLIVTPAVGPAGGSPAAIPARSYVPQERSAPVARPESGDPMPDPSAPESSPNEPPARGDAE
jgi:hypothetical protein